MDFNVFKYLSEATHLGQHYLENKITSIKEKEQVGDVVSGG